MNKSFHKGVAAPGWIQFFQLQNNSPGKSRSNETEQIFFAV